MLINNHNTRTSNTVVMNETVFESSSSFINRPEEYGDNTGSSIGGFAASSAVPAGSWPPGIVPEIQSGFK